MSTTLETITSILPSTGNIIPYKDWVIVTQQTSDNISVQVYEVVDDLSLFDLYEARLELIHASDEQFEDQGRGVQWAFQRLEENHGS